MEKTKDKDLIFGLDIGTRTVIGVLGYYEDQNFYIVKTCCYEHEERAMRDGQIHDIEKVTASVEKVKADLEKQIGKTLKEVAIAAAGRVLTTQIAEVTLPFDEQIDITPVHIQTLHYEGINIAQQMMEKEKGMKDTEFFCVGHTVMQYFLDGYPILKLEGHKGKEISAKVLATFLPKEVVTSLYTVTQRVGLEVTQLTLEPIAAINAVIPENLRLLNLALVDVGAGTSDLAITKEGSVIAYGMIPIAGDEVTEAIVHQYLVDFQTAEKIKQQIDQVDQIAYTDIIGLPYEVSSEDVKAVIQPVITGLANQIAQKIKILNGDKATNAVFCVGGGSQMNGLTQQLSHILGLPEQRVALRNCDHIPNLTYKKNSMKGPEMITPIGICLTSARSSEQQFTKVSFNGEPLMLLNAKKLSVLDALIERGIKHQQIFPSRGKALMYKLDGERVRVKGLTGTPARILCNGLAAQLEQPIKNGDQLVFEAATAGESPTCTFARGDVPGKQILVNDQKVALPLLMANGDYVSDGYQIAQQDELERIDLDTIGELLTHLCFVYDRCIVRINGEIARLEHPLSDGDCIQVTPMQEDVIAQGITLVVNEQDICLPEREAPYLFAHIFDFIDFDLTKPQGTIQLQLNDERAAVTDLLKNGDRLQIYWEK
ncbi:MAG: cell division FtsA domain-containing protein [Cellulosilyticaceae bacterium]